MGNPSRPSLRLLQPSYIASPLPPPHPDYLKTPPSPSWLSLNFPLSLLCDAYNLWTSLMDCFIRMTKLFEVNPLQFFIFQPTIHFCFCGPELNRAQKWTPYIKANVKNETSLRPINCKLKRNCLRFIQWSVEIFGGAIGRVIVRIWAVRVVVVSCCVQNWIFFRCINVICHDIVVVLI